MEHDDRMDEISALLRALDHPTPTLTADALAARARARGRSLPIRWAAAALLTVGAAGAAFAIPGSPLARWAARVGSAIAGGRRPPASDSRAADRGSQGIAVMPGRTLVVEFSSQPGGLATVALSNRPDVMVRAGAGAATFTTESDRLLIEGGVAPDTFAVEIPRDAPRVEIRASGRRVLLAERGSITTDAAADSGGMYRIELGGK